MVGLIPAVTGAKKGFKKAIEIMNQVDYDRSNPKPQVLIVGEYLLNFHPGANHEVERYLDRTVLRSLKPK